MAAQTIANAFPFVYWITLVALAGGCFGFAALAGRFTDATRGYLRFTAVSASLLALLAIVTDLALPEPALSLAIEAAPPDLRTAHRTAMAALVVTGFLYAAFAGRPRVRELLEVAGLVSIGIAWAAAAFGWAQSLPDAVPLLLQFVALSGAMGGGLAALILGHWYLVTPKISTRPLVVLTLTLALILAFQLALFVIWALFGGGPGQVAFESITGSAALYGWLRLVVSLVFPLILAAMAWRTALTRSMESATGLLYIAIAAISAGTIGAAALYVTQGILV